jgi:hypothetical protein
MRVASIMIITMPGSMAAARVSVSSLAKTIREGFARADPSMQRFTCTPQMVR